MTSRRVAEVLAGWRIVDVIFAQRFRVFVFDQESVRYFVEFLRFISFAVFCIVPLEVYKQAVH